MKKIVIKSFKEKKEYKKIIINGIIKLNINYFIYKIIIFLLIIIIFLTLNFEFNNYKKKQREFALIKGRDFIKNNLEGILINKEINHNNNYEPKISVIIPVYNCENSIKSSIRSIQNQNMYDIEIILVNDYSNDNSLKIIEKMKIEDKRIKIINNNKNMGTLYSRNIGVLKAEGRYILALDNDDMFLDEDVFYTVYNESEKNNYDIIGFKAIDSPNYNANISQFVNNQFHRHRDNLILYQPYLSIFPISKNNKYYPNDFHIWGKCINTNVYKNAIYLLGKDRYSIYMSWHEDTIMVIIIFKLAKSYKFIGKYGIFHLVSKSTASCTQPKDNIMFGEIFFLDIIFDFTNNNTRYKKIVVEKALELKDLKLFDISNYKNKKYLISVLNKIIMCKYISDKDKKKVSIKYSEILDNEKT